jgi:hypothetical protein
MSHGRRVGVESAQVLSLVQIVNQISITQDGELNQLLVYIKLHRDVSIDLQNVYNIDL